MFWKLSDALVLGVRLRERVDDWGGGMFLLVFERDAEPQLTGHLPPSVFSWAGERSRMMERVLAQEPLAPFRIDRNETHEHGRGRRRLCEVDGLLTDHAPRLASNGNVRHAVSLDPLSIAEPEVHAFRTAQIRRETRHEQVIVRRDGALDAGSRKSRVLAHALTGLFSPLEKPIADHHAQRPRSRQPAEAVREFDHLPEPVATAVARHQVFLDLSFIRRWQERKPVVDQKGRVERIRTFRVHVAG
jgi:hypothetical protein